MLTIGRDPQAQSSQLQSYVSTAPPAMNMLGHPDLSTRAVNGRPGGRRVPCKASRITDCKRYRDRFWVLFLLGGLGFMAGMAGSGATMGPPEIFQCYRYPCVQVISQNPYEFKSYYKISKASGCPGPPLPRAGLDSLSATWFGSVVPGCRLGA